MSKSAWTKLCRYRPSRTTLTFFRRPDVPGFIPSTGSVSKVLILLKPGGASGDDEARGETPPRIGRSQPQECGVDVVVVVLGVVRHWDRGEEAPKGREAMVKAQQAVMETSTPVSSARIFERVSLWMCCCVGGSVLERGYGGELMPSTPEEVAVVLSGSLADLRLFEEKEHRYMGLGKESNTACPRILGRLLDTEVGLNRRLFTSVFA